MIPGVEPITVRAVRLVPYRLPLHRPVRLGLESVSVRQGIWLCVENAEGVSGWGEAAPLPSFSTESYEEVVIALEQAAEQVSGKTVDSFAAWCRLVASACPGLPASAAFGLDLAFLRLASRISGLSLSRWINRERPESMPLCRLVEDPFSAEADIGKDLDQGWHTFKVKAGRSDVSSDKQMLLSLSGLLTGKGKLRVDANRAWSREEVVDIMDCLDPRVIDYLEEPLGDPGNWPSLRQQYALVDFAADESLREDNRIRDLCDVFVVKPTLTGGISRFLELLKQARGSGKRFVLSSAFETPVGLSGIAELAAGFGLLEPLGLDTARHIAASLHDADDVLCGPTIVLDDLDAWVDRWTKSPVESEL